MGLVKMFEDFLERRQTKKHKKIVDNAYNEILADVEKYSSKTETTKRDAKYTRKNRANVR